MPSQGNDEMVYDLDAEQPSGFREAAGHGSILVTGARVAARMIVYEDDRCRRRANRPSEDLAWVDQARRQRAHGDLFFGQETMATIEQQDVERFPITPAEAGQEMTRDVLRASKAVPADERPLRQTPRKIEGRDQARRFRRAETRSG